MSAGASPLAVELFVRSLAPDGARPSLEGVVERLQRLETRGPIDEVSVHVTGEKVCPEGATARTEPGQFLLERVAAFEAWADHAGRSLSPHFRRVESESGIDGTDHSGVEFPLMAMAEYEGGDRELRFVSPSVDGEGVVTVRDRLDRLEQRAANGSTGVLDERID